MNENHVLVPLDQCLANAIHNEDRPQAFVFFKERKSLEELIAREYPLANIPCLCKQGNGLAHRAKPPLLPCCIVDDRIYRLISTDHAMQEASAFLSCPFAFMPASSEAEGIHYKPRLCSSLNHDNSLERHRCIR